jgi:ribosomal protein S18 acetylase RimI-like enzyme
MAITLRPVVESDQNFLFDVYASTRRDEVSAWGWELPQQDAFLKMQWTAQWRSYEMQTTNASHDVILCDGEPIGRLLVTRSPHEIHLVDISLLPTKRNNGIGTQLIRNLLEEGETRGLPVRLEVLQANPAVLLYERLGFVNVGESGFYFRMEKK